MVSATRVIGAAGIPDKSLPLSRFDPHGNVTSQASVEPRARVYLHRQQMAACLTFY
ncbi:hypothetical protein EMIT0158MI4_40249 [Burkholderia ambifaria]